jgi:hypothetical protein
MSERNVHGQRILVISVADFTSDILSIWALVDDALRVVDVTILPCATWAGWLGWVLHVNEYDTGSASVVTRHGADRVDHIGRFIGNDVVSAANGQTLEMAGEILLVAEDNWL